jgi:hypothetical protein
MVREVCQSRKALAVLFLLTLMLYAQLAVLFAQPEAHQADGHCCVLCHLGSLPFLQVATAPPPSPMVVVERLIPNRNIEALRDVLLNVNSSRAPPA